MWVANKEVTTLEMTTVKISWNENALSFTWINISWLYETPCLIWYHFCNLKNVQNTHGEVLLLIKLQASVFGHGRTSWKLLRCYEEELRFCCVHFYVLANMVDARIDLGKIHFLHLQCKHSCCLSLIRVQILR